MKYIYLKIIFVCLFSFVSCSNELSNNKIKIITFLEKSNVEIKYIGNCSYSISTSTPPLEGVDKMTWTFDLKELDSITIDTSDKMFSIYLNFSNAVGTSTEIEWLEYVNEKEKLRYKDWDFVPIYNVSNGHETVSTIKRLAKNCGASVAQN